MQILPNVLQPRQNPFLQVDGNGYAKLIGIKLKSKEFEGILAELNQVASLKVETVGSMNTKWTYYNYPELQLKFVIKSNRIYRVEMGKGYPGLKPFHDKEDNGSDSSDDRKFYHKLEWHNRVLNYPAYNGPVEWWKNIGSKLPYEYPSFPIEELQKYYITEFLGKTKTVCD